MIARVEERRASEGEVAGLGAFGAVVAEEVDLTAFAPLEVVVDGLLQVALASDEDRAAQASAGLVEGEVSRAGGGWTAHRAAPWA